MQRYKTKLGLV